MITLDFETRSTADLIRWGQRRYAMDASTQALCMCWSYDAEEMVDLWHRAHAWAEQSATPYELIERIRSGEPVEAHNAGFEFNIWNISLRREFPEFDVEIKPEQLYCSAAKASCVSLPRSLGDAVNAVGLLERKLADGRRLINKLSKPMPRRNIIVTPGDPWKKAVRASVYAQFEMGGLITNEEVYELAEAIALEHNEPPDAIREAVRNLFVREVAGNQSRPATMERLSDGVYKWVAEPIMPKMVGTVQVVEKGPLLFCEEEIEHRKNWEYCKQDVRAERELSKFCPEMSERERDFWLMDFRMNQRGVTLDREAVAVAMDMAMKEADKLNERLSDLTGGKVRKGSQRIPLLAWANGHLRELGLPELENTKADTLSFALDGVPTKAGDEARDAAREPMRQKWEPLGQEGAYISEALRICMEVNRSSVAKYKRMEQSVCEDDGRIHDIMLYNGADRTGRWSGKGVQPHNFVRGYSKYMTDVWHDLVYEDRDFIEMVWEEPMVVLAKACRGALIASEGKELYAADFNAIEARKLAWLSGCAPMLNLSIRPGHRHLLRHGERHL
jgi:DNA polymerase